MLSRSRRRPVLASASSNGSSWQTTVGAIRIRGLRDRVLGSSPFGSVALKTEDGIDVMLKALLAGILGTAIVLILTVILEQLGTRLDRWKARKQVREDRGEAISERDDDERSEARIPGYGTGRAQIVRLR
jgi:hypothetical protein